MYFFPQCVDDTPYVAGEDSSLAAEEADPGYFAEEGKPPSKTQTPLYLLLLYFLTFVLYHAIIFIWFGIILVMVGKLHTPPKPT